MGVLFITLGVIMLLVLFVWLGLRVRPQPFPPVSQPQPPLETLPLTRGLPAPVERFFRQTYGEQIPIIKTAVITGRGTIRLRGLTLPVRFRFTHEAGRNYRHYIEATFFGLPIMKVNEFYVNGRERMEIPTGVQENNPKLDQGGNLGMWAESIGWLPAILATDPRVRWETVDGDTAFLVTPFGQQEERFLVRFDPVNGNIKYWEVMRYRNGEGEKILWLNGMWIDEGRPWALFDAEEVVFNVPVDVKARGA
jgi:hypothetical protein